MSDHEEEEASLPGDAASAAGDAASAAGDAASADTETQKDRTELSESPAAGTADTQRSFGQRMQDAKREKAEKRGRGRPAGGGNAGRKRPADEADAGRKRRSVDDTGGDREEREQEGSGINAQKKLKLTLPIHKFHKALRRQSHTKRVGTSSAVILTSIIEYVTSEILELAGNTAKEMNKNRIIPKHIQQAVRTDEELNKYLANVTIAGGGVVPQVHATALPKKEKPQKARQPAAAAASAGVIADSGSQVY